MFKSCFTKLQYHAFYRFQKHNNVTKGPGLGGRRKKVYELMELMELFKKYILQKNAFIQQK